MHRLAVPLLPLTRTQQNSHAQSIPPLSHSSRPFITPVHSATQPISTGRNHFSFAGPGAGSAGPALVVGIENAFSSLREAQRWTYVRRVQVGGCGARSFGPLLLVGTGRNRDATDACWRAAPWYATAHVAHISACLRACLPCPAIHALSCHAITNNPPPSSRIASQFVQWVMAAAPRQRLTCNMTQRISATLRAERQGLLQYPNR